MRTALMRIVIEFSSFGWTEESISTDLFTTGPPGGQTVFAPFCRAM